MLHPVVQASFRQQQFLTLEKLAKCKWQEITQNSNWFKWTTWCHSQANKCCHFLRLPRVSFSSVRNCQSLCIYWHFEWVFCRLCKQRNISALTYRWQPLACATLVMSSAVNKGLLILLLWHHLFPAHLTPIIRGACCPKPQIFSMKGTVAEGGKLRWLWLGCYSSYQVTMITRPVGSPRVKYLSDPGLKSWIRFLM